jgi:hypothetical protein
MELEEFLEIILDKGLLAILLLIVGLWVNRLLANYESMLEQKRNTKLMIAQSRLPSFTSLWEITAPTSPTRTSKLSEEERQKLDLALRDWYYQKGNGIFLTNELRETYLAARKSLVIDTSETEQNITKLFSKLRTDLKNEVGIYGSYEDK